MHGIPPILIKIIAISIASFFCLGLWAIVYVPDPTENDFFLLRGHTGSGPDRISPAAAAAAAAAGVEGQRRKNNILNHSIISTILFEPVAGNKELTDDFFCFEVSEKSLRSGVAKRAIHGTAHL